MVVVFFERFIVTWSVLVTWTIKPLAAQLLLSFETIRGSSAFLIGHSIHVSDLLSNIETDVILNWSIGMRLLYSYRYDIALIVTFFNDISSQ